MLASRPNEHDRPVPQGIPPRLEVPVIRSSRPRAARRPLRVHRRVGPFARVLVLIAGALALHACGPGGGPPWEVPEPRIGIRVVGGMGEFYDRTTGSTFVMRGGNYNRWADRPHPDGGTRRMDLLFNVDENQLTQATADLDLMAAQGYNTVRVWWDHCDVVQGGCMGDPAGGIRPAYLANIVRFLELLAERDMYVIFTMNEVPDDGGYGALNATSCCDDYIGYNLSYLSTGGRAANRAFFGDVIDGLVARRAPLDRILAFELRNEPFFERNYQPFTHGSGMLTTANGETYDLGDADDLRRMMNENMVDWIDDMAGLIRDRLPGALVTIGYFHDLGPDSDWMAYAPYVVAHASLDFYAHHAYPEGVLTYWDEYADSFELADYPASKPLVLGEFGVGKFTVPDPADAAMMVQHWQVESCALGFGGWLHWTWNSGELDVPDLWAGTDAGGAVNAALAPAARPDPCAPGAEMLESDLLSFRRPVTVSNAEPGVDPRYGVDLSMHSWWSAGGGAPQWIEVDLEAPRTVAGGRDHRGLRPRRRSRRPRHAAAHLQPVGRRRRRARARLRPAARRGAACPLPRDADGRRHDRAGLGDPARGGGAWTPSALR